MNIMYLLNDSLSEDHKLIDNKMYKNVHNLIKLGMWL